MKDLKIIQEFKTFLTQFIWLFQVYSGYIRAAIKTGGSTKVSLGFMELYVRTTATEKKNQNSRAGVKLFIQGM